MGSKLLRMGVWVSGCCALAACVRVPADTLVIRAERVIRVAGPEIRNGMVVVRDGKITAVGQSVAAPAGARVIRAAVAMPGLVDPHTYLGCRNETDEPVDAITPDLRACDAFDPESPLVRRALHAGITVAGLAPGNSNVVAGQMAAVRLGRKPVVLAGYAAQKLSISLDAANAQRNPTSRAGVIALARAALSGADAGVAVSSTRQTSLLVGEYPTRLSERSRALRGSVRSRTPSFIHAPETADVEAALRLAADYGLTPVLVHATGAARIAEAVRSRGAAVVLGPLSLESEDRELSSPVKLARAGVKVAFCTDAPDSDPASLRMTAHLAAKRGMPADAAIRAITLSGAEALGLGARTGSLTAGKDADILLLSGDPLDLTSRVMAVISGGKLVYEAAKR